MNGPSGGAPYGGDTLPADSEEFADALPLFLADAVWAVARDGDTRPATDIEAALRRWSGEPSVAKATALAANVVCFRDARLEPLHRTLVRVARKVWCGERDRWSLAYSLRDRAETAWSDEQYWLAADLLVAAIDLCDTPSEPSATQPEDRSAERLLDELLRMLTEVLEDTDTGGADTESLVGAARAAKRRADMLSESNGAEDPRYLAELADACQVAAALAAAVDDTATALEYSERGGYTYEAVMRSRGPAVIREVDNAWNKHIELLGRAGQTRRAREWQGHRTAILRALTTQVRGSTVRGELMTLLRMLDRRELRSEAVEVSARIVELAAAVGTDHRSGRSTLLGDLCQHGRYLHIAGRRSEALDTWWRAVETDRRGPHDSADQPVSIITGFRRIIATITDLGDRAAAVEFGAAAVAEASRFARDDPEAHLATAADELRAHAERLFVAGRFAEASDTAEDAVARSHELVARDAGRYRPHLSWALTCATRMHLRSWRRGDAERRSRQAHALIEDLARDEPDRYRIQLADALHNRALVLLRRGEHSPARRSADQAIAVYETCGDATVDALANVLCTQSICSSAMGEFGAAWTSATRAKEIYARLVEHDRARYLPGFVYALNRLASVHEDRRGDEAPTLAVEALTLCDSLSEGSERDECRSSALHQMVRNLHRRGRSAEALKYSTALVKLRERLAEADPVAREVELAIALGNHGSCLSDTGALGEALHYSRRGAELMRRLAGTDLSRFRRRLADALDKYAVDLHATGAFQHAATVSSEAVTHFDALLAENPARNALSGARCFDNHAMRLGAIGRVDQAVASGARGLALLEPLAAQDARLFGPDLCHILVNQAIRTNTLGRHTEALGNGERAVTLLEELAGGDPQRLALELARALLPYSYALSRCGRYAEAVAAQRRAVRVVEAERRADRRTNQLHLARALDGLVARLTEAEQTTDAGPHSQAAVVCWREITAHYGPAHRGDLARALLTHAEIRCAENEWTQAGDFADEAASVYAALATEDTTYRPDWARSMEYQAWALSMDGKHDRAGTTLDRALALRGMVATESPAWGRNALAASATWAARIRLDLGESAAAAADWERGILLYRELIDSGRDDLIPDMLAAHHRYATRLGRIGHLVPATQVIAAALPWALYLVAADRARHRHHLTALLRDHVWISAEAGQRGPALAVARAVLAWELEIAGAPDSGDRRWYLADGYDRLADSFAETGQFTDALEANDHALPVWEELAAATHRPSFDLAWSLWRRARWLGAAAAPDATVIELSRRAVGLFERLCTDRRDQREFLAGALVDQASHLARMGEFGQAWKDSCRARALWESLAADDPRRYRPELVGCLRRQSTYVRAQGRQDAALMCARRALRIAEEAVELAPDRFEPELAAVCDTITDLLCDSDPVAATATARRAVTLYSKWAAKEPTLFAARLAQARSRAATLAARTVGGAGSV